MGSLEAFGGLGSTVSNVGTIYITSSTVDASIERATDRVDADASQSDSESRQTRLILRGRGDGASLYACVTVFFPLLFIYALITNTIGSFRELSGLDQMHNLGVTP